MGIADIAVRHVDSGLVNPAIFEQLEEDRGVGDAENRGMQVNAGVADELADIGGLRVPAEDDLEAKQIAVEGDRALQVPHGEPGMMRSCDGSHSRVLRLGAAAPDLAYAARYPSSHIRMCPVTSSEASL